MLLTRHLADRVVVQPDQGRSTSVLTNGSRSPLRGGGMPRRVRSAAHTTDPSREPGQGHVLLPLEERLTRVDPAVGGRESAQAVLLNDHDQPATLTDPRAPVTLGTVRTQRGTALITAGGRHLGGPSRGLVAPTRPPAVEQAHGRTGPTTRVERNGAG